MKVKVKCGHCLFVEKNGSRWTQELPIGNSTLYKVTCPLGHTTLAGLQNLKFDILFESGISALKIGYHREAVSSFAVALERFYEYCIMLLMRDHFQDPETGVVKKEGLRKFDKLFKTPLKLSERQIGAFCALHFQEFDSEPTLFDSAFSKTLGHKLVTDPVNFRNTVIHAGYVPSYDEALEYGEAVHFYIDKLLDFYRTADKGELFPRFLSIINLSMHLDLIRIKESSKIKEQANLSSVTATSSFLSLYSVHKETYHGDEKVPPLTLRRYVNQSEK